MTELQRIIWVGLATRTRRAILRVRGRGGRRYVYRPRGVLLKRIATEQGISIEDAYSELMAIRKHLIHKA